MPARAWRTSSSWPGSSARWCYGRSTWRSRASRPWQSALSCSRPRRGGPLSPAWRAILSIQQRRRRCPLTGSSSGCWNRLRPTLESTGDWELVAELTESALARGSSAARQRAACASGGLEGVVDMLVAETRANTEWLPGAGPARTAVSAMLQGYAAEGDEAILFDGSARGPYGMIMSALDRIGIDGLSERQSYRDEVQRRMGMIFHIGGEDEGPAVSDRPHSPGRRRRRLASVTGRADAADPRAGGVPARRLRGARRGPRRRAACLGDRRIARPAGVRAVVAPVGGTVLRGGHRPGPRRRRPVGGARGQPAGSLRHRVRHCQPLAGGPGSTRAHPDVAGAHPGAKDGDACAAVCADDDLASTSPW